VKNQYVGDFNDYVKYALLRSIVRAGLPLVVCWMLTPDDAPAEGQKLTYLSRPREFRHFDPELFDHLASVVAADERTTSAMEHASLFPNTAFFGPILGDDLGARRAYFRDLWRNVAAPSVIFFDPDNGFEVPSVPKGRRLSSKYIYWDEAAECAARAHSLVVFQHFAREKREPYIARLTDRLRTETHVKVLALRTANVAFFVAAQDVHAPQLEGAMRNAATTWAARMGLVRAHQRDREAQSPQPRTGLDDESRRFQAE
jgi:hypothetical protein